MRGQGRMLPDVFNQLVTGDMKDGRVQSKRITSFENGRQCPVNRKAVNCHILNQVQNKADRFGNDEPRSTKCKNVVKRPATKKKHVNDIIRMQKKSTDRSTRVSKVLRASGRRITAPQTRKNHIVLIFFINVNRGSPKTCSKN